jgi:hypothetical protein
MPGAQWRGPTPNSTPGGMADHRGLVVHVAEGSYEGTISWCLNPAAAVSYHFIVGKGGQIAQLVDTADKAWAQASGNPYWVSVGCEGYASEGAVTEGQQRALDDVWRWMLDAHGPPNVLTDDPNGAGLGWHGMGGDAWGGHHGCPGEARKAYRSSMVAHAGGAPAAGPDAPTTKEGGAVDICPTPSGNGYYIVDSVGAVFTYGDAVMQGGANDRDLVAPIVGMAVRPQNDGYWLAAADGGVFTFGNAPYKGSRGGEQPKDNAATVAIAAADDGEGYWLLNADGGVFNFGSAPFKGAATGHVH